MISSNLLVHSLLLGAAAALSQGWKNGPTATGPTDPNLTVDCDYFANNVQPGDTCTMVEDYFGITEEQFQNWNPELKTQSECKMVPGYSYCVSGPDGVASSAVPTATPASTITLNGTAAPVQTGISKSCTKYHLVKNGDTCNSIQEEYMGFTLSQFYSWNPDIRTGCKGLVNGDYVCVGAKSSPSSTSSSSSFPTMTGVTSNCNKWHFVTGNDTCQSIHDEYDLTQAQFYKWNPATGSKCENLWRKTNVCVGVPGFTPSPTITTATATGTGSIPSPVQSGIASNCKMYYKIQKDDTCESVEKDKGISAADFNKWNPSVGSDCKDLELNVYVCVAA